MSKVVSGGAEDSRANGRSNVFLTATLVAAGASGPVRVRNISAQGALLDGPNLPQKGAAVHLRRGSLSAEGEVAWQEHDRCGVRFNADVEVEHWVRRVGHSGQEQVDTIIAELPESSARTFAETLTHSDNSLDAISADLTAACERIVNLPDLVAAHPDEMLRLDAISQRLRHFLEANDETGSTAP